MIALFSCSRSRPECWTAPSRIAASLAALIAAAVEPATAAAQAPVKIVNFTADWCASCHEFQPKFARALEDYTNQEVELVTIDLTHLRSGADSKQATIEASRALLRFHKAEYLWDWYGGFTGMAAIIAADTGEPMSCMTRADSTGDIRAEIQLAEILVRRAAPGHRRPDGPDCPAPLR